jgi:hypothetical protein
LGIEWSRHAEGIGIFDTPLASKTHLTCFSVNLQQPDSYDPITHPSQLPRVAGDSAVKPT